MGCHSSIGRGLSNIKPGGSRGAPGEMDTMPGNPNTLSEALGIRGKAMSITKAVKNANPFYDPAYGDYSENCQRAVVAVEGRFRGYDIIASPTYAGDIAPYGGNWMKYFKGAKSVDIGRATPKETQNALESQIKNSEMVQEQY